MDTDTSTAIKTNPETSLTESWNVIEAQDINNVSEGSDGESIEVIDEEGQNTECFPSNKESVDFTEIVDKEQALSASCHVISNIVGSDASNDSPTSDPETGGGINLLNACGLLALVFAILFAGATFSVFLLKVEELTIGTFSYFSSPKSTEHNENEFQELLNQLKAYKEESRGLKDLVTDLNSAVLTLKKELTTKKDNCKPSAKEYIVPLSVNNKDTLFEQLLNVHTDNYANENSSYETTMPHEDYFRIIEETLLHLSNGNKREEDMETIKIFSQIPKHLSVLIKFDSSNQNFNEFIETWKEKLLRANEKLVNDIKQMQLKMKWHIIKSLKSTQKQFFEKLCELKYMKSPECYETFIKPYEISDKSDAKISCSNAQKLKNPPTNKKIKSGIHENNPPTPKNKQTGENHRLNFKENNRGRQSDHTHEKFKIYKIPVDRENVTETNSVPGNSHNSANVKTNQKTKNNNVQRPNSNYEKNRVENIKVDKGMNSELFKEPNLGIINSFSSFSAAKYNQIEKRQDEGREHGKKAGYQDYLTNKGESSSWFLRMGKYRSRVRKTQARGDWLFERARYRQRRSYYL